jgi:hypothetical protein
MHGYTSSLVGLGLILGAAVGCALGLILTDLTTAAIFGRRGCGCRARARLGCRHGPGMEATVLTTDELVRDAIANAGRNPSPTESIGELR